MRRALLVLLLLIANALVGSRETKTARQPPPEPSVAQLSVPRSAPPGKLVVRASL